MRKLEPHLSKDAWAILRAYRQRQNPLVEKPHQQDAQFHHLQIKLTHVIKVYKGQAYHCSTTSDPNSAWFRSQLRQLMLETQTAGYLPCVRSYAPILTRCTSILKGDLPHPAQAIFIYFRDHCNEGCCTSVDSACLKFEMPRHSFERFGDPSPRLWRGKWSAGTTRVFSACAVAVLKASISCSPHPRLISGNKVHLLPCRSFNREHIILEK